MIKALKRLNSTRQSRTMCSAILAMLLYGCWTYVANRQVLSALLQGGISFISTLFLTQLMELLYRKMPPRFRFFGAAFLPPNLIVVLAATAHALIGTRFIVITLLPNFIIGSLFSIFYVLNLNRLDKFATRDSHQC